MDAAKEKLSQATDFVKEKASHDTTTISQSAESIKEAAKEKLSKAAEFLKEKADSTQKDISSLTSEKLDDVKESAKDKLAQAQDFVRKQTISDSSKTVKDSAKKKYEDLKQTADKKKVITDETWDLTKTLNKSSRSTDLTGAQAGMDTHTVTGEETGPLKTTKANTKLAHEESNVAGDRAGKKFFDETPASTETDSGDKGILSSVKETAANAAEWVKDVLTPSGAEQTNANAATDEKVHCATEKEKSECKVCETDSTSKKGSGVSDEKAKKNY